MYVIYTVRIVDDRCSVRHGNYSCHSASGCCLGARLYVLFLCLTRISEVYVKIDQSRHDQASFRIYHSVTLVLYFKFVTDVSDHSIFQINIALFISISGRIYDTSATNQNTHVILSLRCGLMHPVNILKAVPLCSLILHNLHIAAVCPALSYVLHRIAGYRQ